MNKWGSRWKRQLRIQSGQWNGKRGRERKQNGGESIGETLSSIQWLSEYLIWPLGEKDRKDKSRVRYASRFHWQMTSVTFRWMHEYEFTIKNLMYESCCDIDCIKHTLTHTQTVQEHTGCCWLQRAYLAFEIHYHGVSWQAVKAAYTGSPSRTAAYDAVVEEGGAGGSSGGSTER